MVISLVQLLVIVLVAAIVWYVVQTLPLPQPFRMVVIVIVALILILWLLSVAGLLGPGAVIRIG